MRYNYKINPCIIMKCECIPSLIAVKGVPSSSCNLITFKATSFPFTLKRKEERGRRNKKNKIKGETVFLIIELVSHHVLIQFLPVNASDSFIALQETLHSFHNVNFIFSHSDAIQEMISAFCESVCFLSITALN